MSNHHYQDLFSDKLKDSLLPIEYNRQKDHYEHLTNLAHKEEEKCRELMCLILAKKQRNEDFEPYYQDLLIARR